MQQLSIFDNETYQTIEKIQRVYCYRKNKSFKIWFDINLNGGDIFKVAIKKARELNKENRYYSSEKIRFIEINGEVIKI